MNKIARNLVLACAVGLAGYAFASTQNTVIPFSSTGDKYGDGEYVIDNEWYVLCWSPNETFGGFDDTLTPLVSDDKVIVAVPFAKDHGCSVTFNVSPGKVADGGNFFVYLLDTRVSANSLETSKVENAAGLTVPASVKGSVLAKAVDLTDDSEESSTKVASFTTAQESVANDNTYEATLGENLVPASISNISFLDDYAVIEVSDMNPYIKYIVKYGTSPKDISSVDPENAPAQKGAFSTELKGDFKFVVDKDAAKFFQVFKYKE